MSETEKKMLYPHVDQQELEKIHDLSEQLEPILKEYIELFNDEFTWKDFIETINLRSGHDLFEKLLLSLNLYRDNREQKLIEAAETLSEMNVSDSEIEEIKNIMKENHG